MIRAAVALAEGQLPHGDEAELVADVKGRKAVFGVEVAVLLLDGAAAARAADGTRVVERFSVGVDADEEKSLPEAMKDARLKGIVDRIGAGLIEGEPGGILVDAIGLDLIRRCAEGCAIRRAKNIGSVPFVPV